MAFAAGSIADQALKTPSMRNISRSAAYRGPASDLGHLAWVLEDVRKSLNYAANAVRRFERDSKKTVTFSARDNADMQTASKQVLQSAGALEMVGHQQPAKLVRAMAQWIHSTLQKPETFIEDAATAFETACRALVDYFEGVLKGNVSSPVALFEQYRSILQMCGTDRIHPADLWSGVGHWESLEIRVQIPVLVSGSVTRRQLDEAMLPLLRDCESSHARRMVELCCRLAHQATSSPIKDFWWIAAAFFEALCLGELPNDVYVRRTAARIIPAFGLLENGQGAAIETLVHELLFYCAFVKFSNPESHETAVLAAVRQMMGVERSAPIDYESAPFGKFDPALLGQLRKHIAVAAEGWSALSGGDVGRASAVVSQFAEVSAAVKQLHPHSEALISALTAAVEITARRAKAPSSAIAIEVATAILYLEIAYDDLDLANHTMEQRSARLAARLQHVVAGGEPLPIERWMEDLYRRVGDRKAIGTVVAELALSLAEIEKSLDAYVRDPAERLLLDALPVALGHMRGVFSVLGLDQAALAALRMRSVVERLIAPEKDMPESVKKKWTIHLVNSLSAMGFLIDMLRYQPAMAKELFAYDEGMGEFRLTMEREQRPLHIDALPQEHTLALKERELPSRALNEGLVVKETISALQPALSSISEEESNIKGDDASDASDEEIQHIFLDEACEVVNEGKAAIIALSLASSNSVALGSLRRSFHTLKGSARMVGFDDLGEAAWAYEQLLNAWLEKSHPASEVLLALCEDALDAMTVWIEALAQDQAPPFQSTDFRLGADALRLENRYVPHPLSRRHDLSDLNRQAPILEKTIPEESRRPVTVTASDLSETVAEARSPQPSGPSLYEGATQNGASASSQGAGNYITIGRLHLRLDFFEVFVNEAGLWAAQLQTEIENWDSTGSSEAAQRGAGVAHALQGSAAAVGFTGLAALAQALERALEHAVLHPSSASVEKTLLSDGGKEVNRLMDAFASGVLEKANPVILQALATLLESVGERALGAEPAELDTIAADGWLSLDIANVPAEMRPPGAELATNVPQASAPLHPVIAEPAAITVLVKPMAELESQDALDLDLWPVFYDEGRELLQGLSKSLRLWIVQPQETRLRAQSLRILHTLKGSARLAGALQLGEIAHQMESAVESVADNSSTKESDVAVLLPYLEQIESVFENLALQRRTDDFEHQAMQVLGLDHGPSLGATALVPPATAPAVPVRSLAISSIRVRAQVLDRMIDQAGEVMTGRTRMEQRLVQLLNSATELGRNLDRMRHQLRDLELQTELQMRSRQTQSPEASFLFDPLELDRFTALQEVSRMMAESVADIDVLHKGLQTELEGAQEDLLGQGRRAKELINGLLRMRLVEFESISDRLYGVVRQAAKETGKQVRLDIEGGSIEMDRGVLDRMTPSFEHMLRNAVVHGIETSTVRVAAGKPATGAISISVQQDGSDVSVRFADDGAGLQLEKIRKRAKEAQLLEDDVPLSYEQAAKLLFIPGFSTADQITELAGRGIGMDVVLSDIGAIGGRIETSAQPNGGTCFQVVFPLTTAVTQIVMLRMENVTIGVPANLLETVLRIPPDRIDEAYSTGVLSQASGQDIPFFWAGAIFGVAARGSHKTLGARQQSVALIRSAGQRVALHVDEVLGNREVVVKNLGTQLAQLPGLVGISVLASGAVVLIYNPVALMNVYGDSMRHAEVYALAGRNNLHAETDAWPKHGGSQERNAPLVLVVDDSITVRRVTQRLLSRAGFRVALASDGVHALELLRDERPALILSDIEMPRMDGMELTRQIRADSKLSDLPIIIITSRTAQKHRDHAVSLGANHYLGKPYAEAELLDLVRSHCAVAEFA